MGVAVMPTYTFLQDALSSVHPPEIALMVDHMKSWYGRRNTWKVISGGGRYDNIQNVGRNSARPVLVV